MIYSATMRPYSYTSALLNSLFPTGTAALPAPPSPDTSGLLSSANVTARQFAKAQAGALIGLASYAGQLKSSFAALDALSPTSVWQQRSITSSAPTAIGGTAANGAKNATYSVNVTQVAVAQQSVGTALNSTVATTLAAGTQTFSLTSAGLTKNISFSVTAGDTNQTVLTNMAQSINSAKAGVTATVTKNAAGTSQLVITANKTGTANNFSLADVTGTAVATTGANTVSKSAADAAYSVNGVSYTSSNNTVTLSDPKVSLTFSAPVTGATIKVENNTGAITSAITNFTNAYNSMVSYISQNQQYLSPQLSNTLKQAFTNNADSLHKAGITARPDGTLSVDQTLLNNSLKSNPAGLMQSLGGFSGIATVSKNLAQRITSSPLNTFAKSSVYNPVSYYPAFNNQRYAYQQWLVGSLFNRLA
jgi:flagellar hook-associated protein 2